jgi:hypothetical protein
LVQYSKNHGKDVEIYGENFNEQHTVWFQDVPCETTIRCPELILCKPPSIGKILGDGR